MRNYDDTIAVSGSSPEAEDAHERGMELVRLTKLARVPEPKLALGDDRFEVRDRDGAALASFVFLTDAKAYADKIQAPSVVRLSDGAEMIVRLKNRFATLPVDMRVPAGLMVDASWGAA